MYKRKIILVCGASKTVINFRKELIQFLKRNNFDVDVIVSDDEKIDKIYELNVAVHVIKFDNRSINLFKSFSLISKFKKIIKEVSPDLVFTFQLKPNIFGSFASKNLGIPIYNMVEGLGDPFQPKNFIGKLLRCFICFLYKKALKKSKKVFFLNNDDLNEFVSRRILIREKAILINGIGIDTNEYRLDENVKTNKSIVCLSRLIRNKGIVEFCQIARIVRKQRKDISFNLYGDESELSRKDLIEYIQDDSIKYCGYTDSSKEILKSCSILVSNSYREGFPRVILEAMSLGKPVIASDVIGNRDIVVNNVTGFLIDKSNLDCFAEKIIYLMDHPEVSACFGRQAREICCEKYDSNIINFYILKVLNSKEENK